MGEEWGTIMSTLAGNKVDNNSTEKSLTLGGAPRLIDRKKAVTEKLNDMTLRQ